MTSLKCTAGFNNRNFKLDLLEEAEKMKMKSKRQYTVNIGYFQYASPINLGKIKITLHLWKVQIKQLNSLKLVYITINWLLSLKGYKRHPSTITVIFLTFACVRFRFTAVATDLSCLGEQKFINKMASMVENRNYDTYEKAHAVY